MTRESEATRRTYALVRHLRQQNEDGAYAVMAEVGADPDRIVKHGANDTELLIFGLASLANWLLDMLPDKDGVDSFLSQGAAAAAMSGTEAV